MNFDIFDEYVKIAEQEGWVKEADYGEARIGSDEISTIEALYGVKPNGKEDDTHIVDKAHPETAVVSPAHDKMNGVVENAKERQNMMAYIALKMPNGNLTQHRYVTAYDDLNKTLIRTAFLLDNKDEKDLMKLADDCVGRLEKIAFPWTLLLAWAPRIAAMVGLLSVVNRTDEIKQNVITNAESAIDELEDISDSAPVAPMISDIQELLSLARSFQPIQVNILSVQDAVKETKQNGDTIATVYKYIQKLYEVQSKIPQWVKTLKTLEPGRERDIPDWLAKIMVPFEGLITSGVDDAINALGDPSAMVYTGGLYAAIIDGLKAAQHVLSKAKALTPAFKKEIEEKAKQEKQIASNEPGILSQMVQQLT